MSLLKSYPILCGPGHVLEAVSIRWPRYLCKDTGAELAGERSRQLRKEGDKDGFCLCSSSS